MEELKDKIMKHVFVINSHTTYLTSMGIIDFNKIAESDILLVLVRNYSNSIMRNYNIIDASNLSVESEIVFSNKINLKLIRQTISKIDLFIEKQIGECYHLYAPHLAHPLWQILYSNKLCFYFSYVQEGYIPYTTAFVIHTPFFKKIENIYMHFVSCGRTWYYRPWFLKDEIKDINKVDAYACNDTFFKYLPVEKKTICWPIPENMLHIDFKEKHQIFIFDAFVSNSIMESVDYLKMCQKLIEEQSKPINYLKFHPGQSKSEVQEIINYFILYNLQFIILDNSVPFEYIIMTKKNLSLTGYGSSLLFLAHDFGHNVCCKDDELLQFPLYQKYRSRCGFMSYKEYANL